MFLSQHFPAPPTPPARGNKEKFQQTRGLFECPRTREVLSPGPQFTRLDIGNHCIDFMGLLGPNARTLCLPHHMQAGDSESTSPTVPSPPTGTYCPRPCPEQPAFGWPLPAPQSSGQLDSQGLGPLQAGATSSGCSRAPAPGGFRSCPHLSAPPRNTASLQGPMLVHCRNKTQKQIKRPFLLQQERGPGFGSTRLTSFGPHS